MSSENTEIKHPDIFETINKVECKNSPTPIHQSDNVTFFSTISNSEKSASNFSDSHSKEEFEKICNRFFKLLKKQPKHVQLSMKEKIHELVEKTAPTFDMDSQ